MFKRTLVFAVAAATIAAPNLRADSLYDTCIATQAPLAKVRFRQASLADKYKASKDVLNQNRQIISQFLKSLQDSDKTQVEMLASLDPHTASSTLDGAIRSSSANLYVQIRNVKNSLEMIADQFSIHEWPRDKNYSNLSWKMTNIPGGRAITLTLCNERIDLPTSTKDSDGYQANNAGVILCSDIVLSATKKADGTWAHSARGERTDLASSLTEESSWGDDKGIGFRESADVPGSGITVDFRTEIDGVSILDGDEDRFARLTAEKVCAGLQPAAASAAAQHAAPAKNDSGDPGSASQPLSAAPVAQGALPH